MRIAYPVAGIGRPRSGLSVYATELLAAIGRASPVDRVLVRGGSRLLGRLQRRGLARLEWQSPRWDAVHFLDAQTVPTARPSAVTVHDLAPFELYDRFPHIYTNAYNPAMPMYRRAIRQAVERCDLLVCVSEATRDQLLTRFPGAVSRAVVIHSGVRMPAADFRRQPQQHPALLLMVGRVEHRKNIVVAAAATRLLRERGRDVELHVAGSTATSESAAVRRQCNDAAAPQAITWHGEVDAPTLQTLHEKAAVLLSPSLLEGFGFPPLEALVAGVPVIASDIPVHRETMGGLTELADPGSVEAWADAITRVLDGSVRVPSDAAERLRARGIAWDLCAASLTQVYAELLGRRGVPRT